MLSWLEEKICFSLLKALIACTSIGTFFPSPISERKDSPWTERLDSIGALKQFREPAHCVEVMND